MAMETGQYNLGQAEYLLRVAAMKADEEKKKPLLSLCT